MTESKRRTLSPRMTANLVILPFVLVTIGGTILHGNGVIGKTTFLIAAIVALCVPFAFYKLHHRRRVRSLRELEKETSEMQKEISRVEAERRRVEAATAAIPYWRGRAEHSP